MIRHEDADRAEATDRMKGDHTAALVRCDEHHSIPSAHTLGEQHGGILAYRAVQTSVVESLPTIHQSRPIRLLAGRGCDEVSRVVRPRTIPPVLALVVSEVRSCRV